MTPIALMIIGGIVFAVSIIVCIVNFVHMWGKDEPVFSRAKMATHMLSGVGASVGFFSTVAGFIWFLVKGA